MPYESLRDFIARLEKAGKLKRVSAPVSPHLEMT
jgi:4-hydroxy-3-polyprenylbenzoate decarboxylase